MLDLQKGQILSDRYTLVDLISPTEDWNGSLGGGATSIIWKARDDHCSIADLETYVAIKFHPHRPTEQIEILFRREAIVLMQLRGHPNIVSVLDLGEWTNATTGDVYAFIVTEYCDTDLATLAERGVGAHLDTFYKSAIDTCRGLAYAHGKNLVHRDIKPANLFLALDRMTVKIGDFGLAKDKSYPPDPRATVVFGGTRGYKSPEKARGSMSARAAQSEIRSDIYSLGVTFYQLLTGQHPFPEGHERELGPPRPAALLNKNVPDELSELVQSMLCYQPTKRPSSIREIRDRLERQHKAL